MEEHGDGADGEENPNFGWPDAGERQPEDVDGVRREIGFGRHEEVGSQHGERNRRLINPEAAMPATSTAVPTRSMT